MRPLHLATYISCARRTPTATSSDGQGEADDRSFGRDVWRHAISDKTSQHREPS